MGVSVTVIMPMRNAWRTMSQSLVALGKAVAEIPIKLVIFWTEDRDSTEDVLTSDNFGASLMDLGIMDYSLKHIPSSKISNPEKQRYANLLRMWAMALEYVETPYLMRVDSDLIIPSRSIYTLLSGMAGNSRLGEYAIAYPVTPGKPRIHNHITCGCAMFRMKALKEIAPIEMRGCDCKWITEKLEATGWEVHKAPMTQAEHIQ